MVQVFDEQAGVRQSELRGIGRVVHSLVIHVERGGRAGCPGKRRRIGGDGGGDKPDGRGAVGNQCDFDVIHIPTVIGAALVSYGDIGGGIGIYRDIAEVHEVPVIQVVAHGRGRAGYHRNKSALVRGIGDVADVERAGILVVSSGVKGELQVGDVFAELRKNGILYLRRVVVVVRVEIHGMLACARLVVVDGGVVVGVVGVRVDKLPTDGLYESVETFETLRVWDEGRAAVRTEGGGNLIAVLGAAVGSHKDSINRVRVQTLDFVGGACEGNPRHSAQVFRAVADENLPVGLLGAGLPGDHGRRLRDAVHRHVGGSQTVAIDEHRFRDEILYARAGGTVGVHTGTHLCHSIEAGGGVVAADRGDVEQEIAAVVGEGGVEHKGDNPAGNVDVARVDLGNR